MARWRGDVTPAAHHEQHEEARGHEYCADHGFYRMLLLSGSLRISTVHSISTQARCPSARRRCGRTAGGTVRLRISVHPGPDARLLRLPRRPRLHRRLARPATATAHRHVARGRQAQRRRVRALGSRTATWGPS